MVNPSLLLLLALYLVRKSISPEDFIKDKNSEAAGWRKQKAKKGGLTPKKDSTTHLKQRIPGQYPSTK